MVGEPHIRGSSTSGLRVKPSGYVTRELVSEIKKVGRTLPNRISKNIQIPQQQQQYHQLLVRCFTWWFCCCRTSRPDQYNSERALHRLPCAGNTKCQERCLIKKKWEDAAGNATRNRRGCVEGTKLVAEWNPGVQQLYT